MEIKKGTNADLKRILDKVGHKEDKTKITKEQLEEEERLNKILSERKPDEPGLNWEQRSAIKLETRGKLPELAKKHKEEGRKKHAEQLTAELIQEEREDEKLKEKLLKEKEIERQKKLQADFIKSRYKKDKNPKDFFIKDKKGNPKAFIPKYLGDFIKNDSIFKTIEGNDKQIYYYYNGYYMENGISLIKKISTMYLGMYFKKHFVTEVLEYIRNTTYIKIDELNHDWINLKNGLLDPITKSFMKHTDKIFCLHQLDIEYNPQAKCPIFEKQLEIKCPIDEILKTTQEMFGYCFLKDQRFEKAFVLYGDRRTMKSTLLYIQAKMLGEKSVEAISLQELEMDKYLPAHLFGKLANICADLSPKELWNTGTFMKITGQDLLTAGKKFEQQITFSPFAKLIFSCNVIPPTTNKNLAFYRRWLPLEYNVQTPKDEIDVNMREKLMKELPGILNWSLKGLDRLLKNSKFSHDPTDEEIKDFYEKHSDSIQSFIFNEISTEFDDVAEKKRDVRKKYEEYCKDNKLTPENITKFGRFFKLLTGCGEKRIGTIPGYGGITFKSKIKSKQEKL